MPSSPPRAAFPALPQGLAARSAALASGGVALMLALVTRNASSITAQVLFGSFVVFVLVGAWLLWTRDVFMTRAFTVTVMLAVALGSILSCTVGLPGRAGGSFTLFDGILITLSFAISALLVFDGWAQDRAKR